MKTWFAWYQVCVGRKRTMTGSMSRNRQTITENELQNLLHERNMHPRPSLVRHTQHVSYHPMDLTSNVRSQLSMQELSDHIRTVFPITKTRLAAFRFHGPRYLSTARWGQRWHRNRFGGKRTPTVRYEISEEMKYCNESYLRKGDTCITPAMDSTDDVCASLSMGCSS